MKKFIYTLAMILGVGFLTTACSEDYLDELTGKYPTPEAKNFTSAVFTRTLEGSNFHFAVALSNGSETLSIEFIDDKYYLTESTFYNHSAAGAAKGHYVKESTSFNGVACANEHGMVFVKKNGDNYTIDGNVWLNDGRIIHINWNGQQTFEEYVPDFGYTYFVSSAPLNGDESIMDNTMLVMDKDGNLLANIQFSTAAGASLEGIYPIVSSYDAAGVANNGYDYRQWGWPIFGGTYTVANGVETFHTEGNVEIAAKNGGLRIVIAGKDFGICKNM